MNVLPQSTGLGVRVTFSNTGAPVSRVTLRVTVVVLPALSVATTVIVLEPLTRVISLLNEPSELTATDAPFTVTVTGLDVTSSVLPDTTRAASFVISSSAGFVRVSVGGIVSIV